MNDARLSFKEMCARFDVTPRTLRYYEYLELLSPEREGRARYYSPREVARMTLILRGRKFGFSLEEIRQLLDLYDHSNQNLAQMTRAYDLAQERLADMERQRQELDEAITDLRDQLKWGADMIASLQTSNVQAAE